MNIFRHYILILTGAIIFAFGNLFFPTINNLVELPFGLRLTVIVGLLIGLLGIIDFWFWKKRRDRGELKGAHLLFR